MAQFLELTNWGLTVSFSELLPRSRSQLLLFFSVGYLRRKSQRSESWRISKGYRVELRRRAFLKGRRQNEVKWPYSRQISMKSISGLLADKRTEEPCTVLGPWNTPPHACDLFTLKQVFGPLWFAACPCTRGATSCSISPRRGLELNNEGHYPFIQPLCSEV
jgi:hypothetical protein